VLQPPAGSSSVSTGAWFALDRWGVRPDIVSFAKGVTSAYLPLGGIMVTRAIKEAMDSVKPDDRWMHAYTYSGHPTCCAVALKNIEIMRRERIVEHLREREAALRSTLAQLLDLPIAGDLRGAGFFYALELVKAPETRETFQDAECERLLPLVSALYFLDGVVGIVSHVQGVRKRPGGFRSKRVHMTRARRPASLSSRLGGVWILGRSDRLAQALTRRLDASSDLLAPLRIPGDLWRLRGHLGSAATASPQPPEQEGHGALRCGDDRRRPVAHRCLAKLPPPVPAGRRFTASKATLRSAL